MGWSVEIGNEGGVLTNYGTPLTLDFVNRLNGLGTFNLTTGSLGSLAVPSMGQIVRIIWDRGLSTQRVHFEGYIQDVRRQGRLNIYRLRGFDLLGKLWQSTLTGVRDYVSRSPHAIIQAAGTPSPLLVNGQGTTVMVYGSAAGVPNKVDGANPGTVLNVFRADSSRMLVNIQRLALQARYDGASYGLEFFAQLEGANNSDPRFYLVKRRERAAAYTPETFNIPNDFFQSRRGTEGITGAHAISVVGAGDGQARIASTLVGSGGLEGIIADKTIIHATNAQNMANRLTELLNPATETITAAHAKYSSATRPGDNVTVTQSGVANVTLRCFEIVYSLQTRWFYMTLGRPRPSVEDPFFGALAVTNSQAHAPQHVGSQAASTAHPDTASVDNLANNSCVTRTLTFNGTLGSFKQYRDEGLVVFARIFPRHENGVDPGGSGDWDVAIGMPGGVAGCGLTGTPVYMERVRPILDPASGHFKWQKTLFFPRQLLYDVAGNSDIGSLSWSVINRTGVTVDVTVEIFAWIAT